VNFISPSLGPPALVPENQIDDGIPAIAPAALARAR
jgi:hypothetical protein